MKTGQFLLGRGRNQLSDEECAAIEGSISSVRSVPARKILVRRGERIHTSLFLLDGMVCRYMDDREGERQIVALHIVGEFVDLHGFPMRRLDHDVATLTPATIGVVEHAALRDIVRRFPHLTRMLWFSTMIDAAMHREWIFRLGRLGAAGRVAHLLNEMLVRMEMIGLAKDNAFALPITQADIAEACGVTPVHVNRVLRTLREENVATFRGGQVLIHDREQLARIGEFDPAYLYPDSHEWSVGEENER